MDPYQITSGVLWNLYNTTREGRTTVFSPHGVAEEITVFFLENGISPGAHSSCAFLQLDKSSAVHPGKLRLTLTTVL